MKVKEIKASSCLVKSKLTDYVINPYTGCLHGCKYCYATFMKKWHKIPEEWGDFLYTKINCPELLEKELKKSKPGHIWMSSVTDPYTPLEVKYKLTRKILEILSKPPYHKKFSLEILTKSTLVKRDFDLLKKLNVELGCSINTLNKNITKIIEPKASLPKDRIKVLKEAQKQGIKVFGFISPVLPGMTNLEKLFKELKFCDYVWVEVLNTRTYVFNRFLPVIKLNFPNNVEDFICAKENPKEFYNKIKKQAKQLGKKYNLKIKGIIEH